MLNVPPKLMLMIRSQVSWSYSSGRILVFTPAPFNRTSMCPKCSTAASTAATHWSRCSTRNCTECDLALAGNDLASDSSPSGLQSARTNRAPDSANAVAIAAPMPPAAPVIRTTLSLTLNKSLPMPPPYSDVYMYLEFSGQPQGECWYQCDKQNTNKLQHYDWDNTPIDVNG